MFFKRLKKQNNINASITGKEVYKISPKIEINGFPIVPGLTCEQAVEKLKDVSEIYLKNNDGGIICLREPVSLGETYFFVQLNFLVDMLSDAYLFPAVNCDDENSAIEICQKCLIDFFKIPTVNKNKDILFPCRLSYGNMMISKRENITQKTKHIAIIIEYWEKEYTGPLEMPHIITLEEAKKLEKEQKKKNRIFRNIPNVYD